MFQNQEIYKNINQKVSSKDDFLKKLLIKGGISKRGKSNNKVKSN